MRTASRLSAALLVLVAGCRLKHAESGRLPGPPTVADSLAKVEQDSTLDADVLASVRVFYDRLSARDWRAVRSAFYTGGTISTRLTPAGERSPRVAVQTVDEFVRRMSDGSKSAVFSERMLHAHVTGYGDMADAWVVRELQRGRRDSVVTERGIDAFHLYRDRGGWRITDLTFVPEQPSRVLVAPPRRVVTPAKGGRRAAP
ncbi:MAG TPA: hypothetical protein VGI92_05305 [Gemmatimonadales bacterium]